MAVYRLLTLALLIHLSGGCSNKEMPTQPSGDITYPPVIAERKQRTTTNPNEAISFDQWQQQQEEEKEVE